MSLQMDLPEVAWYLLQCKPRQDLRALEHLDRQGFECLCPTLRVETVKAGKLKQLVQPIFPGYLFVRLHAQDNWTALRSTRGVSRIVGFSGQPCRVPNHIIEHLMQRGASSPELPALIPGDRVQVKLGPHAELEAIFLAMDGDERVTLLLNILNREQQVRVSLAQVTA